MAHYACDFIRSVLEASDKVAGKPSVDAIDGSDHWWQSQGAEPKNGKKIVNSPDGKSPQKSANQALRRMEGKQRAVGAMPSCDCADASVVDEAVSEVEDPSAGVFCEALDEIRSMENDSVAMDGLMSGVKNLLGGGAKPASPQNTPQAPQGPVSASQQLTQSLADHDKKNHPGGYKGGRCTYRDNVAKVAQQMKIDPNKVGNLNGLSNILFGERKFYTGSNFSHQELQTPAFLDYKQKMAKIHADLEAAKKKANGDPEKIKAAEDAERQQYESARLEFFNAALESPSEASAANLMADKVAEGNKAAIAKAEELAQNADGKLNETQVVVAKEILSGVPKDFSDPDAEGAEASASAQTENQTAQTSEGIQTPEESAEESPAEGTAEGGQTQPPQDDSADKEEREAARQAELEELKQAMPEEGEALESMSKRFDALNDSLNDEQKKEYFEKLNGDGEEFLKYLQDKLGFTPVETSWLRSVREAFARADEANDESTQETQESNPGNEQGEEPATNLPEDNFAINEGRRKAQEAAKTASEADKPTELLNEMNAFIRKKNGELTNNRELTREQRSEQLEKAIQEEYMSKVNEVDPCMKEDGTPESAEDHFLHCKANPRSNCPFLRGIKAMSPDSIVKLGKDIEPFAEVENPRITRGMKSLSDAVDATAQKVRDAHAAFSQGSESDKDRLYDELSAAQKAHAEAKKALADAKANPQSLVGSETAAAPQTEPSEGSGTSEATIVEQPQSETPQNDPQSAPAETPSPTQQQTTEAPNPEEQASEANAEDLPESLPPFKFSLSDGREIKVNPEAEKYVNQARQDYSNATSDDERRKAKAMYDQAVAVYSEQLRNKERDGNYVLKHPESKGFFEGFKEAINGFLDRLSSGRPESPAQREPSRMEQMAQNLPKEEAIRQAVLNGSKDISPTLWGGKIGVDHTALDQKISESLSDGNKVELSEDEKNGRVAAIKSVFAEEGLSGDVTGIKTGPSFTTFSITPSKASQMDKFLGLDRVIAFKLGIKGAIGVSSRIGEGTVDIIVPNKKNAGVAFGEIFKSDAWKEAQRNMSLPMIIGKDIEGKPIISDMSDLKQMLVAGATGQGKSVCLNSMLCSLLASKDAGQLNLGLIDLKQVELSKYAKLPQVDGGVQTTFDSAKKYLSQKRQEMNSVYRLMTENGVDSIDEYNRKFPDKPLKRNVITIDECAELFQSKDKDLLEDVQSILALGRAAGFHMILATQKPTNDAIPGLLKGNLNAQIAFKTRNASDSRVIIDQGGAEKLMGKGDMLFNDGKGGEPIRAQGAMITNEERVALTRDVIEANDTPEFRLMQSHY